MLIEQFRTFREANGYLIRRAAGVILVLSVANLLYCAANNHLVRTAIELNIIVMAFSVVVLPATLDGSESLRPPLGLFAAIVISFAMSNAIACCVFALTPGDARMLDLKNAAVFLVVAFATEFAPAMFLVAAMRGLVFTSRGGGK